MRELPRDRSTDAPAGAERRADASLARVTSSCARAARGHRGGRPRRPARGAPRRTWRRSPPASPAGTRARHRQRVLRQVPVHAQHVGRASAARATRPPPSEAEQNKRAALLYARAGALALARLRRSRSAACHRPSAAQFPVLERLAYLNAGTDGPIPRAAHRAARAELDAQGAEGRPYRTSRGASSSPTSSARATRACSARGRRRRDHHRDERRARRGARRAGPRPGRRDRHLRRRASGPDRPADRRARARRHHQGRAVRRARRRGHGHTTLVAASHVSWITGELAPAELAEVAACR